MSRWNLRLKTNSSHTMHDGHCDVCRVYAHLSCCGVTKDTSPSQVYGLRSYRGLQMPPKSSGTRSECSSYPGSSTNKYSATSHSRPLPNRTSGLRRITSRSTDSTPHKAQSSPIPTSRYPLSRVERSTSTSIGSEAQPRSHGLPSRRTSLQHSSLRSPTTGTSKPVGRATRSCRTDRATVSTSSSRSSTGSRSRCSSSTSRRCPSITSTRSWRARCRRTRGTRGSPPGCSARPTIRAISSPSVTRPSRASSSGTTSPTTASASSRSTTSMGRRRASWTRWHCTSRSRASRRTSARRG